MVRKLIKRCAIALAAWLPFFAIWLLVAMSFARDGFSTVLVGSLISMGSAGLLGIAVWYVCQRWPWPLGFKLNFYLLQLFFAVVYGIAWTASVYGVESLRARNTLQGFWSWAVLGRQTLMGVWFYAVFAGISHAVQTRNRLHERETLAARAEALAALVKFRPNMAEGAIERLGDMLRYSLKEDGRELVEFSEEYHFTRQYLAFEQLRYEDRLKVDLQIDPESFNYDLPPFSIQTLAENAVQHAIAIRPEGGSIWIKCSCSDGRLQVTVRDDGPGHRSDAGASHQFGLRSLRDRLQAAYGYSAELRFHGGVGGFEAGFIIPSCGKSP